MTRHEQIIDAVNTVYNWINTQTEKNNFRCRGCGRCCDFKSYGHRLFVTSPEILYFKYKLKNNIAKMTAEICPYMIDNQCSVHKFRFAGCRIFVCQGSDEIHSAISESSIQKFKQICIDFDMPYRYTDLKTALKTL